MVLVGRWQLIQDGTERIDDIITTRFTAKGVSAKKKFAKANQENVLLQIRKAISELTNS